MLAFLKRRPFLLSCVIVLLACSFIEGGIQVAGDPPEWAFYIGVFSGDIALIHTSPDDPEYGQGVSIRAPRFGKIRNAGGDWNAALKSFGAPLWLPLSAAIGWIVFRELRFKESDSPRRP